jgi:hypothetical protein
MADDNSVPFPYSFEARIAKHGVGKDRKVWYSVLFLPPEFEARLPFSKFPRLRVIGEIADIPVSGAWMPTGDGSRYFIVSPSVRKTAEVDIGDRVEMRFRIDDQDRIDMPEALQSALESDPPAKALWDAMTAGRRRGFTHLVHGAKSDETRGRRVAEIIATIKFGGKLRKH